MSLKNEDFLRQKYLEEGLSLQEIAAETVSSWKTVRRHLLYMRIPLKPKDRTNQRSQRFGTQIINGVPTVNSEETKTIEKLKELRAEGLSYRAIVDAMNKLDVPCRKPGARWHVKTVFDYIKRS